MPDEAGDTLANVIFASMLDRRGLSILSIRDQHTSPSIRRRRLMTLVQLFLIHRYRAGSLHYLTPTDDNQSQTQRMQALGIFTVVRTEIGQIIVADVDRARVGALVQPDGEQLAELIRKPIPPGGLAAGRPPSADAGISRGRRARRRPSATGSGWPIGRRRSRRGRPR